jgi:hypothetical protein
MVSNIEGGLYTGSDVGGTLCFGGGMLCLGAGGILCLEADKLEFVLFVDLGIYIIIKNIFKSLQNYIFVKKCKSVKRFKKV